MYPEISIFGLKIYSFWLCLSVACFLFLWMNRRLSQKHKLKSIVFENPLLFALLAFICSRLFYILSEWREFKFFIWESWFRFFFMTDYNFSLAGLLVGLACAYLWNVRNSKQKTKALHFDILVVSFLFAGVIWYLGAFLGGQVYGSITEGSFGVLYTHSSSYVPGVAARIPLAAFYSLWCAVIFAILYMVRLFVSVPWFIWRIGLAVFCGLIFIGELYNGSGDIFHSYIALSLNQIVCLGIMVACCVGLFQLSHTRSDN